MPSLDVGGAEKSLINLLNEIDYTRYEVDLFLITRTGFFISQIPPSVNVLEESPFIKYFSLPVYKSVWKLLTIGKYKLVWNKIAFTVANRFYRSAVHAEQKNWQFLKVFFPRLEKHYDAAIGYLEKNANYIAADCVNADVKIGWIHTDLEQLGLNFTTEKDHFIKLDYIVTVSEGLTERLKKVMPEFAVKIRTIENINSPKTINRLAEDSIEISFDHNFINLIFVGRLEKVKGLDRALSAIKILLNKDYKVRLYIIGDGSEKKNLQELSHNLGIRDYVFFLGMKPNPYPYIRLADIYILTSTYEGKSISLEEAKILEKPIVITDFSSASDQIKHQITGLIAEKLPESIAYNLEQIINDSDLKKRLITNLRESNQYLSDEVQKLYKLIDSSGY